MTYLQLNVSWKFSRQHLVWWTSLILKPGSCLSIKTVFPMYGDSHAKDKTSQDCLIFKMGIPILARQHLYIETAPRRLFQYKMLSYQYRNCIINITQSYECFTFILRIPMPGKTCHFYIAMEPYTFNSCVWHSARESLCLYLYVCNFSSSRHTFYNQFYMLHILRPEQNSCHLADILQFCAKPST